MSESTELTTATAIPVRREFARVESAMGIMDTSRFEHLGRVAQVMARAGLMPQSLTHEKAEGARDTDPLVMLPPEVIVARAYLIANQADLWNADPMAVAQCTSLVHGKLMYEGKLVHGIISAKLGVDLKYEFGRYYLDKRDIVVGEMPPGDDQGLGVRVSGMLPGEAEPRTISGSVAMWHKGAKSPWGAVTAWPRQLRYMGAREWARAHKPSLLLGIITDDEIEEYDLARQVGRVAPAGPQPLHADFADKRITADPDTYPDPKASVAAKRAARKAADKPQDAPATPEATTAPPEPETPASEAAAALDGDDLPDGLKTFTAPEDVKVLEVETLPQSDDPATSTSEGWLTMGPAPAGVVYRMPDSPVADGRAITFKDGVRFSTCAADNPDVPVYEFHAPEIIDPNEAADHLPADMPPEVKAYALQIQGCTLFADAKKALADFQKGDFWKTMTEDGQNELRFNTWDILQGGAVTDLPAPHADISAFRLWLEWEEEPETIEQMLSTMEDTPEFKAKAEGTKEMVRGAAAARLQALAE